MKIPQILKPSKKKIAGLIIFIIIAVAGFNFFGPKKTIPLQFSEVKKQDIKSTVSSSGVLTGKNVANLKFRFSGKLAYVDVKVGDKISKNQIVAGLDTQDLAIALQQAQNILRDKQAIVDKTLDDVKDHASDETYTQRQTRTTAQVARDNAVDSVKAAQRAFQDAVITSPIDGIVTQAINVSGQVVFGADLIAQVVDNSEDFFDTDVDEADISKISLNEIAEISLDTYPNQIFKGLVSQILPQTKTTSSGATVVTVRIKLDSAPTNFVNGLSGEGTIITQTSSNTLTIPQEALREDNTVVVQVNNKLEVKKVEKGISSDTDIEIKSGLSEGEKVLLNPPAPGARLN